jgi:hypothetical protein
LSSSIKRVTACLICFSSSHADPAYCSQLQGQRLSKSKKEEEEEEEEKGIEVKQLLLSTEALLK